MSQNVDGIHTKGHEGAHVVNDLYIFNNLPLIALQSLDINNNVAKYEMRNNFHQTF